MAARPGLPAWVFPTALAFAVLGFSLGGGSDAVTPPEPAIAPTSTAWHGPDAPIRLPPTFESTRTVFNATLRTAVCETVRTDESAQCFGNQDERSTRWALDLGPDVFQINVTLRWNASSPATEALALEYADDEGRISLRGTSPVSVKVSTGDIGAEGNAIGVWWAPHEYRHVKAYMDQPIQVEVVVTREVPGGLAFT